MTSGNHWKDCIEESRIILWAEVMNENKELLIGIVTLLFSLGQQVSQGLNCLFHFLLLISLVYNSLRGRTESNLYA